MLSVKNINRKINIKGQYLMEPKMFTIDSTQWSIGITKQRHRNSECDLYIVIKLENYLKQVSKDSVKAIANIFHKDIKYKNQSCNPSLSFEFNLKSRKSRALRLEFKDIIHDLARVLDEDYITIYIELMVADPERSSCDINLSSDLNFKLIVKEKEFFVSKEILASRSPVFQSMFCNEMKEKNESQCIIEDPQIIGNIEGFEKFLDLMSGGTLADIEPMAEILLYMSDKYQVKELVTICEQLLLFDLNIENALNSLIISDKHNCIELKTKVIELIVLHKPEFDSNDLYRFVESNPRLTCDLVGINAWKYQSQDSFDYFAYALSL